MEDLVDSKLAWDSPHFTDWAKVSIKWSAVTLVAYWGVVPHAIRILVYTMGADIAVGFLAAVVTKSLSSERSLNGLIRKSMVLILIYVIRVIGGELNLGTDLGQVVALGYIANEVISIMENCVRAGIPVPKQLVDVLAKFKYRPIQMSQEDIDRECGPEPTGPRVGSPSPEGSKA